VGGEKYPCWGEMIFYHLTDQGDAFYTCEGHVDYSMLKEDDENNRRYINEPRKRIL
jgi:hypothetical protein